MLKTEGTTFVDYGAPACTDKQTLSHARGFMIGDGANVSGGKTVAHRVFFQTLSTVLQESQGLKALAMSLVDVNTLYNTDDHTHTHRL